MAGEVSDRRHGEDKRRRRHGRAANRRWVGAGREMEGHELESDTGISLRPREGSEVDGARRMAAGKLVVGGKEDGRFRR